MKAAAASTAVIWHDVECGSYSADLTLWDELARDEGCPVLDLGCGSGRVALYLARRGLDVVGVDSDPDLVAALAARSRERGLSAKASCGDVRVLALEREFPLAIAPMQVVQLLGTPGRARFLERLRSHLRPGGLAALALANPLEGIAPEHSEPPLPDVREDQGWVYSSRPLSVGVSDGTIRIERLRQAVSPAGELSDECHLTELDVLSAETVEAEGVAAGLEPAGRREIGETDAHVGSTVVLLRRPA